MSWFGQQFEPAAACHVTEQYANNPVGADHGHLKAWLRPIRVLKRFSSAQVISTVHPFVQNHRGHYERGMDIAQRHQLTAISPNSPVPSDRGSTPDTCACFHLHKSSGSRL